MGRESSFRSIALRRQEEANAYMPGHALSANPIGVNFDPDELVEQFKKGVSEQQLLARPQAPPPKSPREHGLGTYNSGTIARCLFCFSAARSFGRGKRGTSGPPQDPDPQYGELASPIRSCS